MAKQEKTPRRLVMSVVIALVLVICLTLTTLALNYAAVTVDNNSFTTGIVKINLNDGKAFIRADEFLFEPGMTVEKPIFLQNESTDDVYYRLYFRNIKGDLAKVLDVTIREGDTVLLSGKLSELTGENIGASRSLLKLDERKELTVVIHYPEASGNDTQSTRVSFELYADAVQSKNNPDGLFD